MKQIKQLLTVFRARTLVSSFTQHNTQELTREERAAVTIQKAYRGYVQRKLYLFDLNEDFLTSDRVRASELELNSDSDDGLELLEELEFISKNISRQRLNAARVIQRYWRMYKENSKHALSAKSI